MKYTPLSINFQRYSDYLLEPDEVVLFERLIFKQYSYGLDKYFYYTGEAIENDTRIKRRRIEAILFKFKELGVLDCVQMIKKNGSSKTKHFKMNTEALLNDTILSQIINNKSEYYKAFKVYIKEIAYPF